jgi:hypothetical protein
MKKMISWVDIQKAIALSDKLGAEILEKFIEDGIKRRISVEEVERVSYQVGKATMTLVLQRQFGIKELYN